MVECPRCGRDVDALHPVPPTVLTPAVMESVGRPDEEGEVVTCEDCIRELTEE